MNAAEVLKMKLNQTTLRVKNGGLIDTPLWEEHRRDRNWASIVEADPNAMGGLRRAFWQQGRGDLFYYIIPEELSLRIPCVIEFGADYITTAGKKRPKRWYGVAVRLTNEKLHLVGWDDNIRQAIGFFDLLKTNQIRLQFEGDNDGKSSKKTA